jgi:23S rRNA (uracil1939-C5)-methyltransferase
MAKAAGRVIGGEVGPEGVADARDNAIRNGIENAEFFCGDAGEAALELERKGIRPDVVVVDPPRKGLNADAIEAMAKMAPRRIVYVSCDPATLARDVALLKEKGYAVKNAMAADLFPRCAHVETIVLLGRKDIHERIKFDVNVEDLHGRASATATYPEIKAYVLEKFGLKVSSLYIAQIKEKCGLDKKENFNIGEVKSRPLICPPEKEQAIMDAFRHFGMIDT